MSRDFLDDANQSHSMRKGIMLSFKHITACQTKTVGRLRRRGFTALWMSIGIVAVLGFCSLSVDYGRVQTAKTELRNAADAASRAAVAGVATSIAQAQSNAINIAAANSCDGTAITITNSDIDFGTWD